MKKKTYVEPQTKVFEVEDAELICQSPGTGQIQSLEDDDDYEDLF